MNGINVPNLYSFICTGTKCTNKRRFYPVVFNIRAELKNYIIGYSTKRIKLRLKGMSPAQYRAHYYREVDN